MKSAEAFKEFIKQRNSNRLLKFEEDYKYLFDDIVKGFEYAINKSNMFINYVIKLKKSDFIMFGNVLDKYGYTYSIDQTIPLANDMIEYYLTISL